MGRHFQNGKHHTQGFAYLLLLFSIATFSVVGYKSALQLDYIARLEMEAELLFVGSQYRAAIASYYHSTPGTVKAYPKSINDLLLDKRFPATKRHLRKHYRDPLALQAEWEIVESFDGGIMGVFSSSKLKPIKTSGFYGSDFNLNGRNSYSEWRFVHLPD